MPRDPLTADVAHAADAALYSRVIRRLGRNARPPSAGDDGVLDADEAGALWTALLAGRFSAAQEAALLMGLRVHGESAAMLAAFARAGAASVCPLAAPRSDVATVVLPCFGAARRQPTLAPLLALALQQRGVPVLVITPTATGCGSSAGVMAALGARAAVDGADTQSQLQRGLAWTALATLSPDLARLVARRGELGFRNSAHAVVKLMVPMAGPVLQVASYTHPAYRASFAAAFALLGASAWLMRGTEGDPVGWDGDTHAPQAWLRGAAVDLAGDATARPALALAPGDDNAAAAFIADVLAGRAAWPAVIVAQADRIAELARRAVAQSHMHQDAPQGAQPHARTDAQTDARTDADVP